MNVYVRKGNSYVNEQADFHGLFLGKEEKVVEELLKHISFCNWNRNCLLFS